MQPGGKLAGHCCPAVIDYLAFGTLLVKELVDRVILRLKLKQDGHDDKQRFAQVRRAPLA